MNKRLDEYKILIYGTGGNGRILYRKLVLNQYKILGFIDKRADEIGSIENRIVYNPLKGLEQFEEKEDIVVIITVKNVFSHMEIAQELFLKGFTHIIFKSSNILNNVAVDEIEKEIDRIYELIVENRKNEEIIPSHIIVPKLDKVEIRFKDQLLIEEKDNFVYAWLPVELLFNYKDDKAFSGVNMAIFFPLVELYKAFLADETIQIEECIENFYLYAGEWVSKNYEQYNDSLKKSLLESRFCVFNEMQKLFEAKNHFFIENAPYVVKEGKNSFYMTSSGRNRVSFLIAKGYKYVPVKMSKKDYSEWCKLSYIEGVQKESAQRIKSAFAPFPNPYLVSLNYKFVDYQRLFLQGIANDLIKAIYKRSVIRKNNIDLYDLHKTEMIRKQFGIKMMIDDGNIGKEYFKRIDFSECILDSNNINILIFEEEKCSDAMDFLSRNKVNEIYVLTSNKPIVDVAVCSFGYQEKRCMFRKLCLDGILQGIQYTMKKEQ